MLTFCSRNTTEVLACVKDVGTGGLSLLSGSRVCRVRGKSEPRLRGDRHPFLQLEPLPPSSGLDSLLGAWIRSENWVSGYIRGSRGLGQCNSNCCVPRVRGHRPVPSLLLQQLQPCVTLGQARHLSSLPQGPDTTWAAPTVSEAAP